MHCWRVLCVEPKWKDFWNKRTARNVEEPVGGCGVDQGLAHAVDLVAKARPIGTKAVKRAEKAVIAAELSHKHLAVAAAQIARTSQKRLRVLEEANALHLFLVPLDSLDADARSTSVSGERVCSLKQSKICKSLTQRLPKN